MQLGGKVLRFASCQRELTFAVAVTAATGGDEGCDAGQQTADPGADRSDGDPVDFHASMLPVAAIGHAHPVENSVDNGTWQYLPVQLHTLDVRDTLLQ